MRIAPVLLFLNLLSGICALQAQQPRPGEEAVRKVLQEYVAAWLAGDAECVMGLFATDAALVPHHGLSPVVGAEAIRAWWWPKDSPPTTIDEFTLTHQHIEVSANMAFARSTQSLAWTTGGKRFRNRGNAVTILRRERDGRWRIVLQMWGDPPNQRL